MLKIDFKKMAHLFSPIEIELFVTKNFFNLKTTDVIRLRKLSKKIWQDNADFIDRLNDAFNDKKSVLSLAHTMLKRQYGDDIQVSDIIHLSEEKYNAFWDFARKIVEYKAYQKSMSIRGKKKYLTTHK